MHTNIPKIFLCVLLAACGGDDPKKGGKKGPTTTTTTTGSTTTTGTVLYEDADGDGYGNPDVTMIGTWTDRSRPSGWSDNGDDCNDAQPTAYPGAPEIRNDGNDQDCDGRDATCDDPGTLFDGDLIISTNAERYEFCRDYSGATGELEFRDTAFVDLDAAGCICSVGSITIRGNDQLMTALLPHLTVDEGGSVLISDNALLESIDINYPSSMGTLTLIGPESLSVADFSSAGGVQNITMADVSASEVRLPAGAPGVATNVDIRRGNTTVIRGLDAATELGELEFIDVPLSSASLASNATSATRVYFNGLAYDVLWNDTFASLMQVDAFEFSECDFSGPPVLPIGAQVGALQVYLSGVDSLLGFEGIESVDSVYIADNDQLTSLMGFPRSTTVLEVRIERNALLSSMQGMQFVDEISSTMVFRDNPSLTSMLWMENLATVRDLTIGAGNTSLTTLDGLDSLTQITGDLNVDESNLTSFAGLEQVQDIAYGISASDCPDLVSLDGLDSLQNVGGNVWINNNPLLAQSIADDWAATVGAATVQGTIDVSGNGGGLP